MKQFILLFSLIFAVGLQGFSQTAINGKVTGSYFLPENTYGYFWGTTADTVKVDDTISLVLRVKGEGVRDLNFAISQTDSVTGNYIFAGSMDAVTWTNIDTITYSDVMTTQTLSIDDFSLPYLRVYFIGLTNTEDSQHKLYFISRND